MSNLKSIAQIMLIFSLCILILANSAQAQTVVGTWDLTEPSGGATIGKMILSSDGAIEFNGTIGSWNQSESHIKSTVYGSQSLRAAGTPICELDIDIIDDNSLMISMFNLFNKQSYKLGAHRQGGYSPQANDENSALNQGIREREAQRKTDAQARESVEADAKRKRDAEALKAQQEREKQRLASERRQQEQERLERARQREQERKQEEASKKAEAERIKLAQLETEKQARVQYLQDVTTGTRLVATKCPDGEGKYYATGTRPKIKPEVVGCIDVRFRAYCPGSVQYSEGTAHNFIGMSGCFGDTYDISPKPPCKVDQVRIEVIEAIGCAN